jgi:hypothetical protein
MRTTSKFLAAAAVMISMATTEAHPGQLGGYRHASPSGYVRWTQRRGAPRFYNMPQQPDLGAAIAGALAGAALQLIPRATEALIAKLPPAESAQLSTAPPVAVAQPDGSPPSRDTIVFSIASLGALATEYQVYHVNAGGFRRFSETEVVEAARELALHFVERVGPR